MRVAYDGLLSSRDGAPRLLGSGAGRARRLLGDAWDSCAARSRLDVGGIPNGTSLIVRIDSVTGEIFAPVDIDRVGRTPYVLHALDELSADRPSCKKPAPDEAPSEHPTLVPCGCLVDEERLCQCQ